jgi:peptidoglycan/LPS O-acetylase OafA/YrhL
MIAESRNDEIEALRAIAVLLVVFSHLDVLLGPGKYPAYDWMRVRYAFWIGVDLFFCISGYVIARSLLPKIQGLTGAAFWSEVVAFWIRRWYRIAPSAWAWVAILLFLTAVLNDGYVLGHLQSNITHALHALLNIANFHTHSCAQAASSCQGSPFTIYWSLSLEEQFYLILPLAAALAGPRLALLCLALVLVQLFLDRSDLASLLWFIRTDAILLGVLMGIASNHGLWRTFEPTGFKSAVIRWPVLALLLISLGAIPAARTVSFGVGFAALISCALVFLAAFNHGYLISEGPLRRALAWLGSRSFAIYLIHGSAFSITSILATRLTQAYGIQMDDFIVIRIFVAIAFLLLLSELNFRFLERPMRLRGRNIAAAYLSKNSAPTPSGIPHP